MRGEDSEVDALRLVGQFSELRFVLDDFDVGSLTLILDGLAIYRVDHDFEKVPFKIIGRSSAESRADIDVLFHPLLLVEGDAAVDADELHSLLDIEFERSVVKHVVGSVSEMGNEFC